MAALPLYQAIPRDEKHADQATPMEKYTDADPNDEGFDPRVHHPASIGGQNLALANRGLRAKTPGLSKAKKALLALGLLWFSFIVTRKIGSNHGHHKHWRPGHSLGRHELYNGYEYDPEVIDMWPGQVGGDEDEITSVPTIYGEPKTFIIEDQALSSANASFPVTLKCHRSFDILFDGIDGQVVLSRSDVKTTDEDSVAEVIVETTYDATGASDELGVEMVTRLSGNELTFEPRSGVVSQRVHVRLPMDFRRRPGLSVTSTKSLNFVVDPSAMDVEFDRLAIRSDLGDLSLEQVRAAELELETINGTIGGTYNVSRALVIRTLTGDIDAQVHVLPPWNGPSRRPPQGEEPGRPRSPDGPKHGESGDPDDAEGHDDNDDDDAEDDYNLEKRGKHHKKHGHDKHKKKDKHRDHHEERKHHGDHDDHDEDHHHVAHWFTLSWLFGKKHGHEHPPVPPHPPHKPHHPHEPHHPPPPPHGPHHPHDPHHRHPRPPHGPPGPHPVFIGAFSTIGRVNLTILSQDVWTSSEVKAFTKVANVSVVHAETFRGTYELGTFKGNLTVDVPEKYKDHKVVDEGVTETGGWQVGIVGYKRPEGETPPDVPDTPNKGPGDPPKPGPGMPPPGSPDGPEDRPPPPKGHSRVTAHTDIGNVRIVL
ncbi:hypothetical protein IAU60_000130 [Kwoniella sp. DSM 27419]